MSNEPHHDPMPARQADDGYASDMSSYRVRPGGRVDLSSIDAGDSGSFHSAHDVKAELKRQRKRIAALQERLYAEHRRSLLVVLQALDTGGKDGAVRGVFRGVNPQGCQVTSFKAPTPEELDHDVLWRYHTKAPGRGMIGIFNRSHYEEVLIVRVKGLAPDSDWDRRYAAINAFERNLADNGTTILKFYLHISKGEQKRRLQSRLDDPEKHWKFDPADLVERGRWDDYMAAFEDALSACSTEAAPWYVVPANHKWYRNLVLARTIADTLEGMGPRFPPPAEGLDQIVIPD